MKKRLHLAILFFFVTLFAHGQKLVTEHPVLTIYKLLSAESIKLKDSLAIYALNFELTIVKKNNRTTVAQIKANDSLAFSLFPCYKKFDSIDFNPLMSTRNKIRLIIPILIYGSSPEKVIDKNKYGEPLIRLNAALSAVYALYRPFPYNNISESGTLLGHFQPKDLKRARSKASYWEAITIEPLIIEINNIN